MNVALAKRKAFQDIGQEASPLDVFAPHLLEEYVNSLDSNIIPCKHMFQ